MRVLFLIVSLLFVAGQGVVSQVTKTGTTAAKFLSIGVGGRANAMGGAFSAVAGDASALYWNPAGIHALGEYQAMATNTSLFNDLDINLRYLALVLPAGSLGSFGLSVTAINYGEMMVTTEYYPEGTGEQFSAGSYALALSFTRSITDNFAVGLTVKYIRENIRNSYADGIAFDVGTLFTTPFYGVKFSSMISNYGSKMQMSGEDLLIRYDADPQNKGNNETVDAYYKTERFELPLKLQIGLSREIELIEGQKLTLAVDAAHPNDNAEYVNVGVELSLFDNVISFRGGYRTLFLKDSQEGLSLGGGVHYTVGGFTVGVDYAFQQYSFLGNTQTLGVMLKF